MKTGIFALIVVAIVGFTVYDNWNAEKKQEAEELSKKIFAIDPGEVTEFEVQKTSDSDPKTLAPPIKFSKQNGIWKIVEPVQDEADSSVVQNFFREFLEEKYVAIAADGDSIKWEEFGLDQPKARFHLKVGESRHVDVGVSSIKNYHGDSYIKLADQKKVYVGNSNWSLRAEKTLLDFRDKRLSRVDLSSADLIVIGGKDIPEFKMQSDGKEWKLVGKDYPLSQSRVRDLLTSFSAVQFSDFVIETNPTNLQKKQYGFEPPLLKIAYTKKDKSTFEIVFGEGKNNSSLAWISVPGKVGKIAGMDLNKVKKYDLNYFRDRSLPLKFAVERVYKVIYTGSKGAKEFTRNGETWETTGVKPGEDFKKDKLKEALVSLSKKEVEAFGAKSQGAMDRKLTLLDEKNEIVLSMSWSSTIPKAKDGAEKLLTAVQVDKSKELVSLDKVFLDNLGLDNLIGIKEESPIPPPPPKMDR